MTDFLDADELAFIETDTCVDCHEDLAHCECSEVCLYEHSGEELMDEDDDYEYWWCHDCGAEWEETK